MTTTITLDIPKDWWLSANDRTHWAVRARNTKHLRVLARMVAQRDKVGPHGTCHVAAFIGYLRGGKADPANSSPTVKALVDGLVDAGVWPDDDSTQVIGPTYLRDPKSPTAGHYRVRLVLTEQAIPW